MMITAKVSIDRPTEIGDQLGVSFTSTKDSLVEAIGTSIGMALAVQFIHSNQPLVLAYAIRAFRAGCGNIEGLEESELALLGAAEDVIREFAG